MRSVSVALRVAAILSVVAAGACAPMQPPPASSPADEAAAEAAPGPAAETKTADAAPSLTPDLDGSGLDGSGPSAADDTPDAARAKGAAADSHPALSRQNIRRGARQVGYAHWYGGRHTRGSRTANGEHLDRRAMTAAHPFLPFGTVVRVTNLETGRSITVRVNDRLRPHTGAIIDLTPSAADRLGARRDPPRVALDVISLPTG